jgi:hypothetical protein
MELSDFEQLRLNAILKQAREDREREEKENPKPQEEPLVVEEPEELVTPTGHKLSDYAVFHFSNVGYWWVQINTGRRIDKGIIYAMFENRPAELNLLTTNKLDGYVRETKEDFSQGCSEHYYQIALRRF